VADAYARALEAAAGGEAVNDAVLLRIAEAAAEVGIDDVSALAQRVREAGILA
jgi:phosphoenolpyruvate synthase/pyruvate phosphate dikinase